MGSTALMQAAHTCAWSVFVTTNAEEQPESSLGTLCLVYMHSGGFLPCLRLSRRLDIPMMTCDHWYFLQTCLDVYGCPDFPHTPAP